MFRQNIVVFICDQLRPDFLSLYGCDAIPTPNLDRLASMGVTFDNAITQSTVCGPARACMMTGRYVSDHRVWTNNVPFRDGMEYLPERMNELGYRTAAFGKLHHFPALDLKGFSHASLMEENRLGENEPYMQWLRERHPEVTSVFNFNKQEDCFTFAADEYYEHWIASKAIRFATEHVAATPSQPLFLWISFQGPHTPLDPPAEFKGTVNADKLPKPIAWRESRHCQNHVYRSAFDPVPQSTQENMQRRIAYAEEIVAIDLQVGRVLDCLETLGLAQDTVYIFSSDHGDLLGDFNLNAKGPFAYHGQLAVPMIVANHPELAQGARSSSLVGNIDIPGTVLDIAGAGRGLGVSRSLLDQAKPEPVHAREVNFSEHGDVAKVVEDRRYRFCYYPFLGFVELFDREHDPLEQDNLAGRPEFAELERRFLAHLVDFQLIAKGVEIPAYDFVPAQQQGLREKHPDFAREFKVKFPLNTRHKERLDAAGLPSDYNDLFEPQSKNAKDKQ